MEAEAEALEGEREGMEKGKRRIEQNRAEQSRAEGAVDLKKMAVGLRRGGKGREGKGKRSERRERWMREEREEKGETRQKDILGYGTARASCLATY